MNYFTYQADELFAEAVNLKTVAKRFGTPCYVYSRTALEQHWQAFAKPLAAIQHLICYAVKANSNLSVLASLARFGAGFDIVSGGELQRVLRAGGQASKIVFSGVGKTEADICQALMLGIQSFNVESIAELQRINTLAAKLKCRARIALRINPDVDVKTHPYISTGLKENKFGIPSNEAIAAYQLAASLENLEIIGIHCHIGSQILELAPFLAAADKILNLVDQLSEQNIHLQQINLGGGVGVHYRDEVPVKPQEYVDALLKKLADRNLRLLLEPGRALVANAGALLTKVEYIKPTPDKRFAICDAGMNDLLRPALYDAWQDIVPLTKRKDISAETYEVVGPVCETADFLGKNRELAIEASDYLAILGAGAYGFSMSSNYNSRPRAAEVMVENDQVKLIRARESIEDLWRGEVV